LVTLKKDGLVEIIEDYNRRYEQKFSIATHAGFKKDIAWRLAHKEHYKAIEHTPEKQIDLLIVVDQMLTGFDSKWINTLYMDKVVEFANIIQAFSRTNRLFGPDKPFGTIRYYRRPHTMEQNIAAAVKLYSGDKPLGLFAQKLGENIRLMNQYFEEIHAVFNYAGVFGFERLPDNIAACAKFASLFKEFNGCLEAARIQGFKWGQVEYGMKCDERAYLILALRYKELFNGSGGGGFGDVPYDIDGYLTEIDTGKIDSDYMNSRFDKYLKLLDSSDAGACEEALNELHKSFAALTAEEQKYANIFLRDVHRGEATIEVGETLRDYITKYQLGAKNAQISQAATFFGLDEKLLRELMKLHLTKANLNEFGRFDKLIASVDKEKARAYFEKKEGATISPFKASSKASKLLREFLLKGGFDIDGESGIC
jgi:type I restriction enzyme R subunit